jgi:hypothetical protein
LLVFCWRVRFANIFLLAVRFAKSVHKANGRRISFSTAPYSAILQAGDLDLISKDAESDALSGHSEKKILESKMTEKKAIEVTRVQHAFALGTSTLIIRINI